MAICERDKTLTLANTRPSWISRQRQPRSRHVRVAHRGRARTDVGTPRTPRIVLGKPRPAATVGGPPPHDKHARVRTRDRPFWITIARTRRNWRTALIVVQPDTVVRWHRDWLRRRWTRRSQRTGGPSTNRSADPRPRSQDGYRQPIV